MTFTMDDAGTDGDEFQQLGIPFETFDREFDADNAVRTHGGGFCAHPRHSKLPRVVHGFGKDIHFLVFGPVAILYADMVDATADTETDRLKACFANQQKLVDGEVGRENPG